MTEAQNVASSIADWLAWMPAWLVISLFYVVALGLAASVHRYVYKLFKRLAEGRSLFWRSLVSRTETLAFYGALCLGLALGTGIAPLDGKGTLIAGQILIVALIGVAALAGRTALNIWMTLHLRRFKLDTDDNLFARKHVTQVRILRRVADTLIVVVGVAAMLMTFESVRQYGVSLLASAGAAGIVAGLALQPLLKNLFAGIQLAITQPIRIDDVLVVEGEWGRVEEITSTYVVVRIWDLRRLILPLSYFIEKPFQNWTREGSRIVGSVELFLDYQAPMAEIREHAKQIATGSPLWDKDVFNVQVTESSPSTMKVRVIVSARNSSDVWDLRCMMREELITFLRTEYPFALPRARTLVVGTPDANGMMAAVAEGAGAAMGD